MPPIPTTRLQSITTSSCTDALSTISTYNHTQAETWNAKIINSILSQLAHASAPVPAQEGSTEEDKPRQRQYKYAVNSTIIQHLDASPSVPTATSAAGTSTTPAEGLSSPPATPGAAGAAAADVEGGETGSAPVADASSDARSAAPAATGSAAGVAPEKGRRGMHSATGAYWNNETDGMWSYKWEGGEKHGVDVVISIIWVAV